MHSHPVRRSAVALLRAGSSVGEVSRALGLARSTVRDWAQQPDPATAGSFCPLCDDTEIDGEAYSALLGFYLGDGHISRAPRYYALRISCDALYPAIVSDIESLLGRVRPRIRTFRITQPGCIVVQAHWTHWPCLFPQHGPGHKHERPMILDAWQEAVVRTHPAAFLRGLFHSDGSRSRNWTQKLIVGRMKRYDYPRWQFTNSSADIRALCCWALDLLEVPWRQSNATTISVSRREGVARLDDLIGPKT